jgi:hypothetical protein
MKQGKLFSIVLLVVFAPHFLWSEFIRWWARIKLNRRTARCRHEYVLGELRVDEPHHESDQPQR